VLVHLSAALAKRDHKVELWQLHAWASDSYADQRAILDSAGVEQLPVAVSAPLWGLGAPVRALAAKRGVNVAHLHGAFNQWNTAVSRALPCPYVFSPHSGYDPISLQRSRFRKALYRVLFERTVLERAALIVGLTDIEVGQIRSFGATGPIVVIPNGVAPPVDGINPLSFRRELSLPPGARLAVFVGRLDVHRKGLDLAVRGVAEASNWHLALVGPRFRDVDRLEKMIADTAVRDRVHFMGERHGRRLHEALGGGDLFVLMSRWEGLPMALLEAMSYGTPAVVSPAVARLIEVEALGAGWVAHPGNLGMLLTWLERDAGPELAARARAARTLAGRYAWESVAEQYEAAYEQAIRSTESGG
jgi:glycosyltransferase involved in cell wall biosynthesis